MKLHIAVSALLAGLLTLGLTGCSQEDVDNFVDDMLCHTMHWNEHMEVLRTVFQMIRDAGFTIRLSKCSIRSTSN